MVSKQFSCGIQKMSEYAPDLMRFADKDNATAPSASQLTFTCSRTAIETLEKGVKYVQS